MTKLSILEILQQDLGEVYADAKRQAFLLQMIDEAIAAIQQVGITLTPSDSNGIDIIDVNLIRMYAAWLVRGRASKDPMPPQLRKALHSRLFAEKMEVSDES